jgi:PAS domain S-box-containing protein
MSQVTDLTEQKCLQEALRDSDRFIGQVAEAMPGILYVYDVIEQRNVYINRQITEILGYSPEAVQAMGATVLPTLTHPDDLPKIAAHLQQFATAQDGDVVEIEYRMRDANGEWHWIMSRELVFARTADGLVQQILGTATDITRLKQIEEELRQSEERFRVALKHSPIIVFNQDTELRYTWMYNPACGNNVEDVVGKLDAELLTAEDAQRLTAIKRQVLTSGVGTRLETSITFNGYVRYLDLTVEPIRDRCGEIVGITCVAIDITDHRQIQLEMLTLNAELEQRVLKRTEELRRANEELRREIRERQQTEATIKQQAEWEHLFGTIAHDIRESLNLDRILTSTVTELQQLLQADRVLVFRLCPDGVGRTIAEAVAPGQPTILEQQFPEETFPEECYEFYRQGNVGIVPDIENDQGATCLIEYFVELGVKSKLVVPLLHDTSVWGVLSAHYCGEPPRQWQEWEIALLKRLGGKVAIAIQQAELYQQVQHALTQEKELNELKSRFISMASHEFRTPLSTILSSADLLEYYIQEGSIEKTLEHIQRIQKASVNMTELLNDILVIGKTEAGKIDYSPSSFDLVKFGGDLVEEMQLSVDSKHELTFVSYERYIAAYMDEKLLWHILTNLLSNAIKYSPKGGNVQLKLFCQDGAAVFQIQDEGIGIPKEDLPHLFESFHRAKNVGTISGSGLGLAIVKRSVDLHSGQIAIESAVGVGTTVTVTLPLNSYSKTDEEDSGD